MKSKTRWLALGLAGMMTVGALLTGCGGSGDDAAETAQDTQAADSASADTADTQTQDADPSDASSAQEVQEADESTTFTWLLSNHIEEVYYSEYEDSPTYKLWSNMGWDVDGTVKKIAVDFSFPPAGSESDNMNTLLATGDYPDLFAMDYCSSSALSLYEEGMILDLTDYVTKYMPNYMAWQEEHPEYVLTNDVDGEERYLQLYGVYDAPENPWGGFMYRRDWIVKYGSNPETGEAFTGGWNEDKTEWTDDVVFPSGNADPRYISDWEWMFEIFEKAMEDLSITDGYAFQIYYPGYLGTGDLNSGFGGGNIGTYMKDKKAYCGITENSTRAYIECLKNWYEKGWLDQAFEEHTGDIFFMIDTPTVYGGKVGLWYGLMSQLGNGMELNDDPLVDGICVYGAAQPINDVYGDDDAKGKEPTCFFQQQLITGGTVITNKAEEKDIATLLTAIDYFYSHEGGLLRTYGFSEEMQNELQDEFYTKWGMVRGAYTVTTNEDGEEIYVIESQETEVGHVEAMNFNMIPGLAVNKNVDSNLDDITDHAMAEMNLYEASGQVSSLISGRLSSEKSDELSLVSTNVTTYLNQAIPDFITGRTELNDANWETFCEDAERYGCSLQAEYLNELLQ